MNRAADRSGDARASPDDDDRRLGGSLVRLMAAYICMSSAMAGMRMAAALLALKLGQDNAAVGALVAFFALPQVVLALPLGRWVDNRGLQVPVRCAAVVAMSGAVLGAVWPLYPVLCGVALLAGASVATSAIAIQRHAARLALTASQLKRTFSWLSMAPALSFFVGPFATGVTIDLAGFSAAFLLLGGLPIIACCCLQGLMTSRGEVARQEHDGAIADTAWHLCQEPRLRRLLLLNCLTAASFNVHAFVVPVLGHERGLSAADIGMLLGAFAIASAVVRGALPLVEARWPEWQFITVALAVTALAFLLYPFAPSMSTMALCSAAIGLATGVVQPIVMSLLHEIHPPQRHGTVVAMRHLAVNATNLLMPMLLGVTGGVVGVSGLFWLMGAVIGVGSRLGMVLRGVENTPRL